MKRSNMIPHGPWVDDCIHLLEKSSPMHPNDRRLIAWTRLQIIAEQNLGATIAIGPRSYEEVADPRTQFLLRRGREQIQGWMDALPPGVMNGSLGRLISTS